MVEYGHGRHMHIDATMAPTMQRCQYNQSNCLVILFNNLHARCEILINKQKHVFLLTTIIVMDRHMNGVPVAFFVHSRGTTRIVRNCLTALLKEAREFQPDLDLLSATLPWRKSLPSGATTYHTSGMFKFAGGS